MDGIDHVVLLSLLPTDRWAPVGEIAVQLGTVPSAIRAAIADAIASGERIEVRRGGDGYRRAVPAPRLEPLPPALAFDEPIALFSDLDLVPDERPNARRRARAHAGATCHRCGTVRPKGRACQACAKRTQYLRLVEA